MSDYLDTERQDRNLDSIIVGFTGTREGMTGLQESVVQQLLVDINVIMAHHGDCIGGDEQFHYMCRALEIPIHIHPPDDDKLRAFCPDAWIIEPPRPFLVRNRIIVNSVNFMIACPKEDEEPLPGRGQGTWSTIRYARKVECLMRTVWPE